MIDFFKKYHKWLGIIISLVLLLFAFSGIILNHRDLLSSYDLSRKYLPDEYKIRNWNNAAVKATEKISEDSILIYGNIGIWLTDSTYKNFKDFNKGIPIGIDNRKVCKILKTTNGELWAGTLFNLFRYDFNSSIWVKTEIPTPEKRVVDIIDFKDSLYFLTRSHLLVYKNGIFKETTLPPPENYDNKIGLFKTLWVIHSGEIYGHTGKLIVDIVGLIFVFLIITGIIIFVNKYKIDSRFKKKKPFLKLKKINFWNLKWHNKIGWITIILLLITTVTGMFLRPPLLVIIADTRVKKIPGTELATPNPWFDQLRRILYDEKKHRFIIATYYGFYYSDDNFSSELKKFDIQPPASVMGVNVLKKTGNSEYLVGSFEGLFLWDPVKGKIYDYIKKEPYVKKKASGPPIGDFLITGYTYDYKKQEIAFDYNNGALNINRGVDFVKMPDNIEKAYKISLWNLALEIHTGRIYQPILSSFYILIVPLTGLMVLFILISGFVVWWKLHRQD
jgi:hypothetical protein